MTQVNDVLSSDSNATSFFQRRAAHEASKLTNPSGYLSERVEGLAAAFEFTLRDPSLTREELAFLAASLNSLLAATHRLDRLPRGARERLPKPWIEPGQDGFAPVGSGNEWAEE